MQDQDQVIKLEGESWRAYAPADEEWLRQELRRRGGKTATIKLATPSDEDDVEGHLGTGSVVLVKAILDEDDTEGHAISLRFPTREEADAFRRRLLATGVLTGALVIGAVGVATVANQQQAGTADSGVAPAAITQVQDVDSDLGLVDQSAAGSAGDLADLQQRADRDIGVMDASGVAAGAGTADADSQRLQAQADAIQADTERAQAAESARLQAMADAERGGYTLDAGFSPAAAEQAARDANLQQSGADWEQQRIQQSAAGAGSVTGSLEAAYGSQTDSATLQSGQDWEAQRIQQSAGAGGSVTDSMDAAYGPGGGAVSTPSGTVSTALDALTGAGYSPDQARAMLGAASAADTGSAAFHALTGAGISPDEAREMIREASLQQSGADWEAQRRAQAPTDANAGTMYEQYGAGAVTGSAETSPYAGSTEGSGYEQYGAGTVSGSADQAVRDAGQDWEQQRRQQSFSGATTPGPMDAVEGGAYTSRSAADTSQAGPMDAIEGGAYSPRAASGPADAIEGGVHPTYQAPADAGPMDPLEAGVHPAYQAPADAGPMDAIEGGAYTSDEGNAASSEDESDEFRRGPTPR